MKRLLGYINNNVLLKVASLNTFAVLTKIGTGFLTSKAIAYFVGAEGMALIGNLRDFLRTTQTVSVLGLYNGVVKYVSEFKENTLALSKTISTAYYLCLITAFLVAILCFFNADFISSYLFPVQNNYTYIIKTLAVILPFYALNTFVLAVINGLSAYKKILIISITAQVLGAIITLFLIWLNKIDGALIAIIILEFVVLLVTLIAVFKQRKLVSLISTKNVEFSTIKKLSSYSVMAMFSAIVLPIATIAVRTYIIDNVSLQSAGFWDAITRISSYYLLFISTLLTLYILPRLSEINTVKAFRKEIFNFYKTIVPVFALGLIIIYFLRNYIIAIAFTSEFQPVEDLFFWQLLGDFVKVLSLVITYQFLAKNMFWHYIITEAFSVILMYLANIYFIDLYGVKGATIAHFVNYIVYFAVILLIFSSSLFGKLPEEENKLNV